MTNQRLPDLVGEISDTTLSIDLDEQKQLYASLGIPEYWVIDVKGLRLFAFGLTTLGVYDPITVSQVLTGLPIGFIRRDGSPTWGLRCAALEADEDQVWGGMVWPASPLQWFGKTSGVFAEELKAEVEARGLQDLLFLTLPEVEEAGSISEALKEIKSAVRSSQLAMAGRS